MKKWVLLLAAFIFAGGMIWAAEEEPYGEEYSAADGHRANGAQMANMVAVDIAPLFRGFAITESDFDLSGFGFGMYYERQITEQITLGGQLTYIGFTDRSGPGRLRMSFFSLAARCRVYPFSDTLDRTFFGVGLGFDRIGASGSGSSDSWIGVNLSANVGHRFMVNNNWFVEPLLGYKISKAALFADFHEGLVGMSGWHIDLAIGYRF